MMKYLLLPFLLAAGAAHAQLLGNTATEPRTTGPQIEAPGIGIEAALPFKRADVVLVHTKDSAAVAYSKLGRLLLTDGYQIEKSDKELGYINTKQRATAYNRNVQAAPQFTVLPSSEGATIEIRGNGYMEPIGSFLIDCRGAYGSPGARAWAELCRVAALYPDARIGYKRSR